MRPFLVIAAALALVASAASQIDHKIVFPLKFESQEGDSFDTMLLNQPGYMRWQQIDGDSMGNPHFVKFLRLRRDGFAAAPNAQGRTIEAAIQMGAGFSQFFGNTFGNNWMISPSTVMIRKTISLPDHSQIPGAHPAPFDITFPADIVYLHTGSLQLVFEIEVWDTGSTGTGYPVDATIATGSDTATTTSLGLGCFTNTSGPLGFQSNCAVSVDQFGAQSAITLAASGAPVPSSVVFWLGASGMPVFVPGLCQPIQVLPPVLSLGPFLPDAAGNVSQTFSLGPYPSGWFGLELFTQAIAPDPSQQAVIKVALSNGQRLVLPKTPHEVWHLYSTTEFAPTGTGPIGSGIIVEISDTN